MITRANIRRQLRASGGITNAISRKDYSMGGSIGGGIIQGNPMGTRTGYFNPFKSIKKAVKKVGNVAKQVIKSPLGKAALIGLGGYMLGPSIGAGFGKMGTFGKSLFGNFASQLGPQATSGAVNNSTVALAPIALVLNKLNTSLPAVIVIVIVSAFPESSDTNIDLITAVEADGTVYNVVADVLVRSTFLFTNELAISL